MENYNVLKKLRIERGFTQKEVADFLCISASAYGYYEQGRNQMDYKTLIKISRFFNVTIDYLINGDCDNSTLLSDKECDHIKIIRCLSEENRGQIFGITKSFLNSED
jgi:transcriptional regulator with XRE-family HTH domain